MDIQVNTIYQYYEQISDRYYVAHISEGKINHLWDPLAKKVKIRGYKEFDFFIIKERYLMLYEGLTGTVILRQCDLSSRIMRKCKMELFIDCLPAELAKRGGRGTLNQLIVNFLVDYCQTISPRYQSIKL